MTEPRYRVRVCMARCEEGPNVQIIDQAKKESKVYTGMTPETTEKLIGELIGD